jgi:heme exporter protein CcmD
MEWWKFNGYGFYVWGSYLVAFAVVLLESALLAARRKRALAQLEDLDESKVTR